MVFILWSIALIKAKIAHFEFEIEFRRFYLFWFYFLNFSGRVPKLFKPQAPNNVNASGVTDTHCDTHTKIPKKNSLKQILSYKAATMCLNVIQWFNVNWHSIPHMHQNSIHLCTKREPMKHLQCIDLLCDRVNYKLTIYSKVLALLVPSRTSRRLMIINCLNNLNWP